MARYTGPKHKLARREGVNILDKVSSSLERRLNVRPGVHGHKRGRKLSEYGIELREKQKAKRIYGVLERQFNKYYKEALKKRGETGSALLRLLETRLDNLVYRLRLAPTRPMARQLVAHGHVQVNNNKVDRPSYQVKGGQVVSLSSKAIETPVIKKLLTEEVNTPDYLVRKGPLGQLVRMPTREDIKEPIDEKLIIEYYSR